MPPKHEYESSSSFAQVTAFLWLEAPREQYAKESPVPNEGTVKVWKMDKGYGWVTRAGKPDAFLHISAINCPPRVGEKIHLIRVNEKGEKGPQVLEALTNEGKRGADFISGLTPETVQTAFVQAEVLHFDSSTQTGSLNVARSDGSILTIFFTRANLLEPGRTLPNKLRIPNPDTHSTLYDSMEGQQNAPSSITLKANEVALSRDQFESLQFQVHQAASKQRLAAFLTDDSSADLMTGALQSLLAAGRSLSARNSVTIATHSPTRATHPRTNIKH